MTAGDTFKPAILLFRGRGLVSSLIRWQTRSIYSHAALLLRDGRIIEAWQGSGVRVTQLKDWRDVDIFDIEGFSDADWDAALSFALGCRGAKYDYRGVFRFVTRKEPSGNDKWFCSELVFHSVMFAGLDLLRRIIPAAVSPHLLALSPYLHQRHSP